MYHSNPCRSVQSSAARILFKPDPQIRGGMVLLAAMSLLPAPALAADDRLPDGLSAADWSSIRAAYEANRHAVFPVDGGYQARNPGQQWLTHFDGRGFETTPDLPLTGQGSVKGSGDWTWGLELVSYGRDGAERLLNGVAPDSSVPDSSVAPANSRCAFVAPVINRCGQRVEYEWDDTLTEWYVNDQRGLEHGYTVHRRPDDQSPDREGGVSARARRPSTSNDDRSLTVAALNITLAVRGDLRPQVSKDSRNVTFVDDSGTAVVNYTGLTVFDARGAAIPAWFEAADFNSAFSILHSSFVRIVIDDTDATYPLTIDPVAQQAYLKASNTDANDGFGVSVAASGDTVVVGASLEDSSASGVNGNQGNVGASFDAGAAYVFVRDAAGVWSQQAYLKASNTGAGDRFGRSVAVSSDTIVVGAYQEDSNATGVDGNQVDNSASASGAAYVFVRSSGVWTQQAYLKASNTGANDSFGLSVDVSGDTVVVGASLEDSNATGVDGNQADNSAAGSGAAYVFVRSGATWSQQAYLKASNTEANDRFGESVAVSGDTVVVGAPQEDSNATGVNGNQADNSAVVSGAAYVFVRSGGVWSQQAYIKASNTGVGDSFGDSVAVSGDTVVVGAPLEASSATGVNGNQADNSANNSGAAYVFVRDAGGVWSQEAYLKASNTGSGDEFGYSVAVSGDTVVVGARNEDSSATGVDGNGADNSAILSGAAYVFVREVGGVWSQQAYLKASNTGAFDNFGESVAVSGDAVVVGADGEESNATGVDGNQADNSAANAGAAYVFVLCPDLAGDMNCDCALDPADVSAFVLALLDPAAYTVTYDCDILSGDMQPDGNVDGGDVQGFVDLLIP